MSDKNYVLTPSQHNKALFKMWRKSMDKEGVKGLLAIGIKENSMPLIYYAGVGEEEVVQFLEMCAEEIKSGRQKVESMGILTLHKV